MAIGHEKIKTIDDILALPDGHRAELIDGVIYDMATPSTTHQTLVMGLSAAIYNFIKEKNGDCSVFPAPFAVFLNNDEYTFVEPDIVIVCDKDKLDEKGCHGAPDMVIEIVSESSRSMDYIKKLNAYMNAGVREYWIVDPEKNNVRVYNFEKGYTDDFSFDDYVQIGIYESLSIKISELI